jgi:site-specific recombinase XerD
MEKKDNPLGYLKRKGMPGRKARVCLPSAEREKFIENLVSLNLDKITIRAYNRYIDEFLRFTADKFQASEIKKISSEMIGKYLIHVDKQLTLNSVTRGLKVKTIKKWYSWMLEAKILKQNPFP